MEDMIIIEQALYALVQALRFNQNVSAMCNRWWAVSKPEWATKLEVKHLKFITDRK